jgi:hypothetical protein
MILDKIIWPENTQAIFLINRDIMYLQAISMGYAIPHESFHAAVHSVFHSALNLRLQQESGLLTLIASSEGDLPQGIRLDAPETFSFEEIEVGEPAVCRDGIIRFENSSLTVQLSGARRWKCDLPALKFDIANPTVSAAWMVVWGALNKRQRLKGSEIVAEDLFRFDEPIRTGTSRRIGEALRDLLNATRKYELTEDSAVNSLIGLGPGLTPSGDDLLVGYVAGLWCTVQDKNERAQFISNLGETISHLSKNTNDISRTYLYHAVRGQVSSRLADLAEAISRAKDHKYLLELAEAAMKIGHTSGMETVTGLLLGFAAWEGRLFSI